MGENKGKRESLFERLRKRTVQRQKNRGQESDDAEDTTQHAIQRALEENVTEDDPEKLFAFTDRTARNKLIDMSRRKKMFDRRHVEVGDEDRFNLHKSSSAEDETINRERTRAVEDAIRKLPHEFQETMRLLMQDYSYEEIAEMTKTPISTVKSRINRARIKMRGLLSK